MAQTEEVVDITEMPELLRLVQRVREARQPIILRAGDEEVATIAPIAPDQPDQPEMVGVLTREQYDRAMSAAGSWAGLVDVDELKAQWKAARGSRRRSIKL